MSNEQLKPFSREWFANKVATVKARVETYPDHIKDNMVYAAATLPTLPNRRATGEKHE